MTQSKDSYLIGPHLIVDDMLAEKEAANLITELGSRSTHLGKGYEIQEPLTESPLVERALLRSPESFRSGADVP